MPLVRHKRGPYKIDGLVHAARSGVAYCAWMSPERQRDAAFRGSFHRPTMPLRFVCARCRVPFSITSWS